MFERRELGGQAAAPRAALDSLVARTEALEVKR
jgi:hypothetical protein